MAKFEAVKAGDVLYDVHMHETMAGNRTGVWEVRVISIDATTRTAVCSWNGNQPRTYDEYYIKALRRSRPSPQKTLARLKRSS